MQVFREKSQYRTFSSKGLDSFHLRVLYHKEICVFKSDVLINVEGGGFTEFLVLLVDHIAFCCCYNSFSFFFFFFFLLII